METLIRNSEHIKWKKIKLWSRDRTVSMLLEPCVPYQSGSILLKQLMGMPSSGKTPIPFDTANQVFLEYYHEACLQPGSTKESCQKLFNDMVGWLSRQGYFVTLTGEEYELTGLPQ